jgi:hypothetical protein
MSEKRLTITPKTKVGEMLDAFPALEEVLLEISPVFAKLKNPILRKTVAKVATLQQAAIIGNIPVEDLINRLRSEVGEEAISSVSDEAGYLSATPPVWFSPDKLAERFDATHMINAGDSPMAEVLLRAKNLQQGELLELVTPFVPAPIIEILLDKGFEVWVLQKENKVYSYIGTI